MHTDIDVVILTYKPDDKFFAILDMLAKQTVKVNRVIVMNTEKEMFPEGRFGGVAGVESGDKKAASDDEESCKDVCCFSGKLPYEVIVRHISKKEFDHGNTRNEGAALAGENCGILVFMTMDAVPYDDKLIENLVKPFENESVGASYARQVADENSPLAEKFTRSFNYPDKSCIKGIGDIERLGIKAFFCSNVCCAYRFDIFKKLGGFVKKAIFNEDMVYADKLIKAGYNIAYAADAKVIHTHNYSGRMQFKRNFDLAVSQKMHPEAFDGISSEKEGIKYVKQAFAYFCKNKKPYLIVPFGYKCVCKYAGYRLGKKYDRLSYRKLLKYSANPEFFEINGR